jgi:hypothetical protein
MAPQAFEEALGIGVVERGVDERIEALMKFRWVYPTKLTGNPANC